MATFERHPGNINQDYGSIYLSNQEKAIANAKAKEELEKIFNPKPVGDRLGIPAADPQLKAALTERFQKEHQKNILSGKTQVPYAPGSGMVPEPPEAPMEIVDPRAKALKDLGMTEQQARIPENAVDMYKTLAATNKPADDLQTWQQKQDYLNKLKDEDWQRNNADLWARMQANQDNILGRMGVGNDFKVKTAVQRTRQSLRNDPEMKLLYNQGLGLDSVNKLMDLVNQGNTVAFAGVGIKMAKAMGEVGVLTEQDIARYVHSGKLSQKAADALSQILTGQPSDPTAAEIVEITSVMKDVLSSKINKINSGYVNSLARNYNMSPEDAAYLLDVPYNEQQPGPDLGGGGDDQDSAAINFLTQRKAKITPANIEWAKRKMATGGQ